MITVLPAEPGTLSFHPEESGELYTRTVIAFSVTVDSDEYSDKYSVDPVDSNMLVEVSDSLAVYHPSTKQVALAGGGVFNVSDLDEALFIVKKHAT